MDTPRLTVLREIEAAVWRELAQCVDDRAHAWRVGVLATTDGEMAHARSVVLREWDAASRTQAASSRQTAVSTSRSTDRRGVSMVGCGRPFRLPGAGPGRG